MWSDDAQPHDSMDDTVKEIPRYTYKKCMQVLSNCRRVDLRKGVRLAYMRKPLVRYVIKAIQCYLKGKYLERLYAGRGVGFTSETFQELHETLQDIDRSELELLVNITLMRRKHLKYGCTYLKELFCSCHMDALYSLVVDAVFNDLNQNRIEKFFVITVTNCDLPYLKSLKLLVDSDLFKGDGSLGQSNALELALASKPDGERV
jgi:hypothetical protein